MTGTAPDTMTAGVRFELTIPAGATILSASLRLYIDAFNDDIDVTIYAQGALDPDAFVKEYFNLSSRVLTTANVEWQSLGAGAGWEYSPNISSVVQEIVDQRGWSSGNHLVLILVPTSDPNAYVFTADAFDSGNNPPELTVTYR